jgi:hypothetical protein
MIDPNFWCSQDVAQLTHIERLILVGLFSIADDFGKGIASPAYILSTLFPFETIKKARMRKWMGNIGKHIGIEYYTVEGHEYYRFKNWNKWQRVDKPQRSKFPNPDGSWNDSENDSKNDSGMIPEQRKLKEVKGKEVKGSKDENPSSLSTTLSQIQKQFQTQPLPSPNQNPALQKENQIHLPTLQTELTEKLGRKPTYLELTQEVKRIRLGEDETKQQES